MKTTMTSAIRRFFAPIVLRFQKTEGLVRALELLDAAVVCDLSPGMRRHAQRGRLQIARELIRRGVIFWD